MFSVLKIPAICPATFTLFRSKPLGFKVTAKGKLGETRRRAKVPLLLAALLGLSLVALPWYALNLTGCGLLHYHHVDGVSWAAAWSAFDLAAIVAAVYRIRSDDFSSDRRASFRFDIGGRVAVDGVPVPLKDLSLAGARVLMAEGTVQREQVVRLEVPVVDFPIPLEFQSVVRSVSPLSAEDYDGAHFAKDMPGRTAKGGPAGSHLAAAKTLPERPRMDQVGLEFLDSDTVEMALLALNLFRTGASILVPHRRPARQNLDLSIEVEVLSSLRKAAAYRK